MKQIDYDRKRFIRRRSGERLSVECVKETVKFGGGSVRILGKELAAGFCPFIRLQDYVNAQVYTQFF